MSIDACGARCPDGSCANMDEALVYYCKIEQCGVATSTDSSVATAISSSATTTTLTITQTTATATSQAASVNAAANVALIGANHQANAGALLCAQGANKEYESVGSGVADVAECQGYFKNADELVKMAVKGGVGGTLQPDEGMLRDAAAVSTLDKFQSNFGVDKDEYVRRMLAEHGSIVAFGDMLGSKFNDEKLDKLFTASGEAVPPQNAELAISDGSVNNLKKTKVDASLRDSMKAKLEASGLRKPASPSFAKTDYGSTPVANPKIEPAGLDPWINDNKEEQEIFFSIFDIMHQKLEDLRRREKI